MTRLSVNLNKIALLRNARGGDLPNVMAFARRCIEHGAEGLTIHPRPDERHITRRDVYDLAELVPTDDCEYNIEGYPSEEFLRMVEEVRPTQCTLVPDAPDQLTSDHGWDAIGRGDLLRDVVERLHAAGIRTSLFIDPDPAQLDAAKATGTDRVELYTGPYAEAVATDREQAVKPYAIAGHHAADIDLGLNAGHDLNLDNLSFFVRHVPTVLEVSIGQAFVRDCLYDGLENTIGYYLRALDKPAR